MLGQWLENILLESTKSRSEVKKEKSDDARLDVAYTQSLDIVRLQVVLQISLNLK